MISLLGKPYLWGGDDPIKGFDCSGAILELLKSVGLWPTKADATSQQLHDYFKVEKVAPAKFGTLLFFGKSPRAVTHVAMAISDQYMFEAGGGGSKTTSEEAASLQNAYLRIRPIDNRTDLVGTQDLDLEG